MKKSIYLALSGCVVSVAQAQICSPNIVRTAPDSRYELVVGSGGSEVLDKKTGLVWQRCSLGQIWSGTTCTGTLSIHTWTDALAKAKAVGKGYRLPNIKELNSLTEKACYNSSINDTFFPNTVFSTTGSRLYWSSSPFAGHESEAWVVDFAHGYLDYRSKYHGELPVRAVRGGQ